MQRVDRQPVLVLLAGDPAHAEAELFHQYSHPLPPPDATGTLTMPWHSWDPLLALPGLGRRLPRAQVAPAPIRPAERRGRTADPATLTGHCRARADAKTPGRPGPAA